MRIGDEQVVNKIVFLDRRCLLAAPTTPLGTIIGERLRFDVAGMRKRHHQVLRRNEVFDAQILRIKLDLRAALVAKLRANASQFVDDDLGNALGTRQDIHQVGDLFQQLGEIGDDLVAFKSGQALQTQFKNRLRLRLGEQVTTLRQTVFQSQTFWTGRVELRPLQHLADRCRHPQARHQPATRICRCRRSLDHGDDFVDIVQRHGQAFLDMRPLARLAQFKNGTPCNDFTPMREEAIEHLLQVQEARLTVDQRHHVHAEGILQLGLLVQAIEHDFRHFAALELDHHAHARFVGLIAQIGNTFDFLVVNQLANLFEQRALVHLVRQLIDNDRLTIITTLDRLEVRFAAHDHTTTPGSIAFTNAGNTVNDCGRREIRRRDDVNQLIDRHLRIGQQGQTGIDDFIEIVRRNIGRHTDRDTRRAIDQQIRDPRRHD